MLSKKLDECKSPSERIIWASYINEIKGGDEKMIVLALNEFKKISDSYSLTSAFHHLRTFNDPRLQNEVKEFINHKDYLVTYNARISLGINTKEIIDRERGRNKKKWWEFWKE